MAPKIAAFLITLVVNLNAGVAVFIFMLLAMNGFSESDSNYGIAAYIVLASIVSITMSIGAVMLTRLLSARHYRSVASVSIASLVFSVTGAILKVVCAFIGIVVAEIVRVNF